MNHRYRHRCRIVRATNLARAVMLVVCFVALVASCADSAFPLLITIDPPTLPKIWRQAYPDIRYSLLWHDPLGIERNAEWSTGNPMRIAISRQRQTPVILLPTPAIFPPIGAIVPLQLEQDDSVSPQLRYGAAAQLLHRLYKRLNGFASLNIERLLIEIWTRTSQRPTALDDDRLAKNLLQGTMTARAIASRDQYHIMLSLEDASFNGVFGGWLPLDPFSPLPKIFNQSFMGHTIDYAAEASVDFGMLQTGTHRYFNPAIDRLLLIEVADDGNWSAAGFSRESRHVR